jgi:adenine-specific DNA-methyltransferase
MARKANNSGPTPVEAIRHADKRVNIPTADAQEWVADEDTAVPKVVYERDPSLDPQLVWRGKYDRDVTELVADAPPIYIQEKIDPRVLVENLRRTAKAGETEPELTLFDGFDGLDELDVVDFYKHDANWSNRMILGDSLQVMASLAEREDLRGKVQMIYIDPPYGINFRSNWQASARRPEAKDGRLEDATREAEQIRAFRDTWELGIHSYLGYLRDRLTVARDLLTESGSIFVQIGDENAHLVRSILDEVLGSGNFVNDIVFQTTTGSGSPSGTTDTLARVSDHLLWYARDKDSMKYRDLLRRKGIGEFIPSAYSRVEQSNGTRRAATATERQGRLSPGDRLYALDNLTSASGVDKTRYGVTLNGKTYSPGQGVWKTSKEGMERLVWAGRVEATSQRIGYVRYLDDYPAMRYVNVWTDTVSSFMSGKVYVVQTNARVIERCLLMCTDPGDLVLDPTCGSGTTAYVAEQWGRRWITIDTSRVAVALARQRVMGATYPFYLLADSAQGRVKEAEVTATAPSSAPITNDIRHGFVYERVQHITLKSIANNPDIREGMTRAEIDAAIKRHAEYELLYDRPYADNNVVRVAGPFTVESLSPHRSLSFDATAPETASESDGARSAERPNFEESILANLSKAGIQNGRRAERIEFASVQPYPGTYLQAIGEQRGEDDAPVVRVGIAIGPQYGTVSPAFVKEAAREALRTGDIGLVAILGFAFDPQATGVTEADGVTVETSSEGFAEVAGERSLGRIKVLFVRMNADLLMGEDLKKTGAGNLFTVFGEPDIALHAVDGQYAVELLGVDVYDPTTGQVRSDDTSRIALWMVDTDYNGESFFVRHCYFLGGNNPLKRLKTALKAEIDEAAWESLYSTTSRPFDRPTTGRIAVKVINDYGDEVMKVFDVD